MTPALSTFRVARFVLEAQSAFAIASGLSDGAFDALVVRDANNLPAIPGSSLAGVLRHLYQQQYVDVETEAEARAEAGIKANNLFGYIRPYEKQEGEPSRLQVSWGCVHGSDDQPVEGIQEGIESDTLLERLAQDHPMHRERVRINERGVAGNQAKFDMTVLPAGCRFSFEISLWSPAPEAGDESGAEETSDTSDPAELQWRRILALLNSPALRLGGSVRSGFGLFTLERLYEATFDMRKPDQYQRFSQLSMGLADYNGLTLYQQEQSETAKVSVQLQPEDFWRIGQGTESLNTQHQADDRVPDALPYAEFCIGWGGGAGQWTPRLVVIPGSSLKGAIHHRAAFHYQRIMKWGQQEQTEVVVVDHEQEQTGLDDLFGVAADTNEGKTSGKAGSLFFSDLYLDETPQLARMAHTSIDRFTGGVRDGVLFLEEMIWKQTQPLTLKLQVDEKRLDKVNAAAKKALQMALDDLVSGRLALGAGSSKGHGYFRGSIVCSGDEGRLSWMGGTANV